MSITLPKGRKTWIFRTWINGKETRWSTGETDRKRAELKAKELEHRAELLKNSPENSRRLTEAAVRLVAEIEADIGPDQARRVADMLQNFIAWRGPNVWLDALDTEMLTQYQRSRIGMAARSTVKKEVGTVLRLLRRNGLHVEKPRAPTKGHEIEVRPFEMAELERFFAVIGPRRAECLLMLATGARPSEIVAVKAGAHKPLLKTELDWEGSRLLIRPSKLKPGEKSRARWIPVQEDVLAVVRSRVETTDGVYAFPRWQNLARDFRAALKRADIPKRDVLDRDLRAHSFRHTYATLMAQQVGNALALSRLLGHKHVSTTERYYHGDPEAPILPMARIVDVNRIHSPDTQEKIAAKTGG